ncbi:MAG: type II toxin-antitoxin system VapC family toxin [Phycisphaerales bacterium JB039]
MRRVYIETTIPSFYYDTREAEPAPLWRNLTRQWWTNWAPRYHLVTSTFTLRELAAAPEPKRAEALKLMRAVEILDDPPELADVTEFYIQHRLMPADAVGDAAHLAIASLSRVDFLLTWNLKHLANANKFRQVGVLNARLGLPMPAITTPLTLSAEGPPDA